MQNRRIPTGCGGFCVPESHNLTSDKNMCQKLLEITKKAKKILAAASKIPEKRP
jgi:hypothetical protein